MDLAKITKTQIHHNTYITRLIETITLYTHPHSKLIIPKSVHHPTKHTTTKHDNIWLRHKTGQQSN